MSQKSYCLQHQLVRLCPLLWQHNLCGVWGWHQGNGSRRPRQFCCSGRVILMRYLSFNMVAKVWFQTKTPPKYPPPQQHIGHHTAAPHNRVYSVTLGLDDGRSTSTHSSFSALSNGHSPPPEGGLPSRDHLRIERDGRLINTMEPPPIPTPQQSQRMREYSEKINKSKAEQVWL